MEYHSKYTGLEVDEYLTRVKEAGNLLEIKEGLSEKANISGRYPEMSVGFSDDLVGRGESVPAEFSFRASGGKSIKDGTARIKRLKGNSVVWNQWVDTIAPQDCDLSVNDNMLTITPQGGFPGVKNAISMNIVENHVYICISHRIGGGYLAVNCGGYDGATNIPFRAKQGHYGFVVYAYDETQPFSITRPLLIDLTQMFQAGNEPTTIEEYEARKPIVADEYAYNEGEVIHMTAEGIKSVGDNAWDEECERGSISEVTGEEYDIPYFRTKNYIKVLPNTQYYFKKPKGVVTYLYFYDADNNYVGWLDPFETTGDGGVFTTMNAPYMRFVCYTDTYNHDITISLYHSGWKAEDAKYQPYWEDRLMFDKRIKDAYPNGMPKWDMVYNKNGKGYIVKGTYEVKMKDLNIRRDAEGVFIAQPIPAVAKTDSKGWSNEIVSARFIGDGTAYSYNLSPYNSAFIVEDSLWLNGQPLASYMTKEDFIRDYGDDILYYQLAEPTIIEYDEPFNLDYRVADFGTEEIIAPQPSAPISADIIYQFNAVDMIREHELEITELQRIIATMQAQLTSLTSNNNN